MPKSPIQRTFDRLTVLYVAPEPHVAIGRMRAIDYSRDLRISLYSSRADLDIPLFQTPPTETDRTR